MDIAEIRRKAKQLQEEAQVIPEKAPETLMQPVVEEKAEPVPQVEEYQEVHTAEAAEDVKIELLPEPHLPPVASEVTDEEKAEEAETTEEDEMEAITFLLDSEEYAVDIHEVKEVIKTKELTEIPRAPKDIVGVLSLRGAVIPVMNLRGRIGMPSKEGGERIIIIKDGTGLLGLLVDNVRHVVRAPKKDIEPPPTINTIDGEFIKGIGRYKGGMFILLDMEKILEKV